MAESLWWSRLTPCICVFMFELSPVCRLEIIISLVLWDVPICSSMLCWDFGSDFFLRLCAFDYCATSLIFRPLKPKFLTGLRPGPAGAALFWSTLLLMERPDP